MLAGGVYSFAKGSFSRGLSANAALRLARQTGIGVRRHNFLSIYRELRGQSEAAYHIRSVRKTHLPNVDRLPHAITNIRREYSFNVRLNLRDGQTGEIMHRNITVSTDRLMTVGDIEAEAEAAYRTNSTYDKNEIIDIAVVEAKRR